MALLKLSNAISGISGRAGNAVYRLTKFGTEFATRPIVNNPDTPAQNAVRSAFTKATQQWRTLTTAQVAAWNEYASMRKEMDDVSGSSASRSGFNWFVGFGTRYFTVNPSATSAPTMPPANPYSGDAISISASAGDAGIVFTASAPNGANSTTAILIQKLRNANAKPGKQYRTITHHKFVSGGLEFQLDVTPGYYAVGYQFVETTSGQETKATLLGIVGPVSLSVQQGQSKKKAA